MKLRKFHNKKKDKNTSLIPVGITATDKNAWHLDCGYSVHMIWNKECIVEYKRHKDKEIVLADGRSINSAGICNAPIDQKILET